MSLSATTTKHHLARALSIAKVCASPDNTLPILHAVNIGLTSRGNLVVQGTDRYLAVRAYLQTEHPPTIGEDINDGGFTISLPTTGLIQKWLTLVNKDNLVTLTVTAEHGLTVTALEVPTLSGIASVEGTYPNLDPLIRPDEVVDPGLHDRAGAACLASRNVTKLGTIAGHCGRHAPVLFRTGTKVPTNDLVFRIGDFNHERIMADGIIMGVHATADSTLHQHGL